MESIDNMSYILTYIIVSLVILIGGFIIFGFIGQIIKDFKERKLKPNDIIFISHQTFINKIIDDRKIAYCACRFISCTIKTSYYFVNCIFDACKYEWKWRNIRKDYQNLK